jgi:hypothetical protein
LQGPRGKVQLTTKQMYAKYFRFWGGVANIGNVDNALFRLSEK